MALVVASGKALKKVEKNIRQRTVAAEKMDDNRTDVSRFSGYNGAYHQILLSCKSTIPIGLSRPFDLFESRLECMSLGHLGVLWDTRMRRNQIMRLAATEIFNEISGRFSWPFSAPDIDDVIARSMKRVARLVSKDYKAPVKIRFCGVTLLRCCCKSKESKSAALNKIMDDIDEREATVVEGSRIERFINTGERNRGDDDFALEDEAYAADQRMRDMEGGDDGYSESYTREGGTYAQHTRDADSYTRGTETYDESENYSRRSRRIEVSPSVYEGSRHQSGHSAQVGHSAFGGSRHNGASVQWEEASETQFEPLQDWRG